jgi:LysM repeat protein
MEIFKDKIFLVSAFGVVLLGLFLSKKNNASSDLQLTKYDTEARNDTLYIPTTETHIDYTQGNKTITHTDNRSPISVGDNSTVSIPAPTPTPKPLVPEVKSTKVYKQITKTSSIFTTHSDVYSIGTIAPQRVEVIHTNPSGWMKIKSWKGDVWVLDGLVKPTKPAFKTHTIKKGETLWGLFGSNSKVQEIAKVNGIQNVNKIQAGVTIKIPV